MSDAVAADQKIIPLRTVSEKKSFGSCRILRRRKRNSIAWADSLLQNATVELPSNLHRDTVPKCLRGSALWSATLTAAFTRPTAKTTDWHLHHFEQKKLLCRGVWIWI